MVWGWVKSFGGWVSETAQDTKDIVMLTVDSDYVPPRIQAAMDHFKQGIPQGTHLTEEDVHRMRAEDAKYVLDAYKAAGSIEDTGVGIAKLPTWAVGVGEVKGLGIAAKALKFGKVSGVLAIADVPLDETLHGIVRLSEGGQRTTDTFGEKMIGPKHLGMGQSAISEAEQDYAQATGVVAVDKAFDDKLKKLTADGSGILKFSDLDRDGDGVLTAKDVDAIKKTIGDDAISSKLLSTLREGGITFDNQKQDDSKASDPVTSSKSSAPVTTDDAPDKKPGLLSQILDSIAAFFSNIMSYIRGGADTESVSMASRQSTLPNVLDLPKDSHGLPPAAQTKHNNIEVRL